MKRDLNLVRKILFEVEKAPHIGARVELNFPDYSEEEVMYHVRLCKEAGLINAMGLMGRTYPIHIPMGLTWKGHDFIDAARDDIVWNKASDKVRTVGGSVSIDVMKALLIKVASDMLGLSIP